LSNPCTTFPPRFWRFFCPSRVVGPTVGFCSLHSGEGDPALFYGEAASPNQCCSLGCFAPVKSSSPAFKQTLQILLSLCKFYFFSFRAHLFNSGLPFGGVPPPPHHSMWCASFWLFGGGGWGFLVGGGVGWCWGVLWGGFGGVWGLLGFFFGGCLVAFFGGGGGWGGGGGGCGFWLCCFLGGWVCVFGGGWLVFFSLYSFPSPFSPFLF